MMEKRISHIGFKLCLENKGEDNHGANTLSFDCNNRHSSLALCFLSIISSRQVSITNNSGNQRKTKRAREENK